MKTIPPKARSTIDAGFDNRFMEMVVDSLPLAMFSKDYRSGTGIFVGWNRTAEKLWGLKKEEVLGKSDFDLFPPDQAAYFKEKDLETIDLGDLIYIDEEPVDPASTGRVLVRTWKVPMAGRYLLGISQDITAQRSMERQLEKQKLIALQSARMASLGEMAGGIAHEINNPLAIIKSTVSLMGKMHQAGRLEDEFFHEMVGSIHATIDRIKAIVNGLRDFSRDGSGDDFDRTPVNGIVLEAVGFCREMFLNKGIDLRVNLSVNGNPVDCRHVQISQVLINLLNNARFAVDGSRGAWVEVRTRSHGEKVIISVTDSGDGIDAAVRDRIFEPFVTTKKAGHGSGLGLSIAKSLIEDHGGRLYLDEKAEFTSFVIELPVADGDADEVAAESSAAAEGGSGET